jgi:flavin-dependent dehydrogenase
LNVDALVIGGRVAGAATALRLAQAGMLVGVAERQPPESRILSSAFVWPAVTRLLDAFGVLQPLLEEHPRLRRWRAITDDHIGQPSSPPWASPGYCLNPARPYLDLLLARRSEELTNWCWNTRVISIGQGSHERRWSVRLRSTTRDLTAECDWIVGADGRRSGVARTMAAATVERYAPHRRWIVARTSGWNLPQDTVVAGLSGSSWYGLSSSRGGQWILSISEPLTELAVAPWRDVVGRIRRVAALAELAGELRSSDVQGTTTAGGILRETAGDGWVLAGDAAIATEPITATGIGFALLSAQHAAAVVSEVPGARNRYSTWARSAWSSTVADGAPRRDHSHRASDREPALPLALRDANRALAVEKVFLNVCPG